MYLRESGRLMTEKARQVRTRCTQVGGAPLEDALRLLPACGDSVAFCRRGRVLNCGDRSGLSEGDASVPTVTTGLARKRRRSSLERKCACIRPSTLGDKPAIKFTLGGGRGQRNGAHRK